MLHSKRRHGRFFSWRTGQAQCSLDRSEGQKTFLVCRSLWVWTLRDLLSHRYLSGTENCEAATSKKYFCRLPGTVWKMATKIRSFVSESHWCDCMMFRLFWYHSSTCTLFTNQAALSLAALSSATSINCLIKGNEQREETRQQQEPLNVLLRWFSTQLAIKNHLHWRQCSLNGYRHGSLCVKACGISALVAFLWLHILPVCLV